MSLSMSRPSSSSSSSSQPSLESSMAEVLQCQVCLESFDLEARLPRLLHSSHTACASCVGRLPRLRQAERIRCPLCQHEVELSACVSNTLVCDMLQALRRHAQMREAATEEDEKRAQPASIPAEHAEVKDDKKKKKRRSRNGRRPAGTAALSPAAAMSAASSSSAAVQQVVPASTSSRAVFVPLENRMDVCLTNRTLFPAFDALPDSRLLNEDCYTRDGELRCPKAHWTFIGEIVQVILSPPRFGLIVRDSDGHDIPVWPYPDNRIQPRLHQFEVGFTLCVRYAERHYFPDGQVGIQVAEPEYVKVIPMSVSQLVIFDQARAYKPLMDAGDGLRCILCQAQPAPKRCAACKLIDYCSKECQRRDWPEHKVKCHIWKELTEIHDLPHGVTASLLLGVSRTTPLKYNVYFPHNVLGHWL